MTVPTGNPFEVLSVPKWVISSIWTDDKRTQAQKVDAILELVKQVYRGLTRALHSDVAQGGDNPFIRAINEAYEDIEADLVPSIVGRYLSRNDLQRQQAADALANQLDSARRRTLALLPLLSQTDWRAVLGSSVPCELVFGLAADLWSPTDTYDRTFTLACPAASHRCALKELHHPTDGDLLDPQRELLHGTPVWEGAWVVRQHGYTNEEVDAERPPIPMPNGELMTHRYTGHTDHGPVVLVGSVPAGSMYDLSAKLAGHSVPGGTIPALSGIAAPAFAQSEELVWWDPLDAWWQLGLKPGLHTGDFGIVAKGKGALVRLAVAGRLLASRPL